MHIRDMFGKSNDEMIKGHESALFEVWETI